MSDQFDKVIAEIQGARKDINDCLDLLAIASPVGKKDCSDDLNEIIQAALPFVNTYDPYICSAFANSEYCNVRVSYGSLRRLIAAISKVTDAQ